METIKLTCAFALFVIALVEEVKGEYSKAAFYMSFACFIKLG